MNHLAIKSTGRRLFDGMTLWICLCMASIALPSMAASVEASPTRSVIMDMVLEESLRQQFNPALALAVAEVESDFDYRAKSRKGARGVMQIMPSTGWSEFGVTPARLYDPQTNIATGIEFLKQLTERYGRVDIALSHYNGGSAVQQRDGSFAVIPATRRYVTKVLDRARYYAQHPKVLASTGSVPLSPWQATLDGTFDSPYAARARVSSDPGGLAIKLEALREAIEQRFGLIDESPVVVDEALTRGSGITLTADRSQRLREWRRW